MKNKIYIAAIVLMAGTSAIAQTWKSQSTGLSTTGVRLIGGSIDANTVWGVGGFSGSTLSFSKTTNGGTLWTPFSLNTSGSGISTVFDLFGANATTAWMMTLNSSSSAGTVYKTTDSGANWISQLVIPSAGRTIYFFDSNNGVAIGDESSASYSVSNNRLQIYNTQNGGTTWTQVSSSNLPAAMPGYKGYTSTVSNDYVILGNTLFIWNQYGSDSNNSSGGMRILKSADKGLTWSALPNVVEFANSSNQYYFLEMAWSTVTKGYILKRIPNTNTPQTGLAFSKTTNGGASWSAVSFTGIPANTPIESMEIASITNTDTLIATSSDATAGGSWVSNNGGVTWAAIDTGVVHYGVKCFSNTCYSGSIGSLGGIYKITLPLLSTGEANAKWERVSQIYPNPTTGVLNIKTEKTINSSTLLDMQGRVVLTSVSSQKIDVSALAKGVYIVNIEFADGTSSSEKVVKE